MKNPNQKDLIQQVAQKGYLPFEDEGKWYSPDASNFTTFKEISAVHALKTSDRLPVAKGHYAFDSSDIQLQLFNSFSKDITTFDVEIEFSYRSLGSGSANEYLLLLAPNNSAQFLRIVSNISNGTNIAFKGQSGRNVSSGWVSEPALDTLSTIRLVNDGTTFKGYINDVEVVSNKADIMSFSGLNLRIGNHMNGKNNWVGDVYSFKMDVNGSPYLHWNCEEGRGLTAFDASGNDKHGTIVLGATTEEDFHQTDIDYAGYCWNNRVGFSDNAGVKIPLKLEDAKPCKFPALIKSPAAKFDGNIYGEQQSTNKLQNIQWEFAIKPEFNTKELNRYFMSWGGTSGISTAGGMTMGINKDSGQLRILGRVENGLSISWNYYVTETLNLNEYNNVKVRLQEGTLSANVNDSGWETLGNGVTLFYTSDPTFYNKLGIVDTANPTTIFQGEIAAYKVTDLDTGHDIHNVKFTTSGDWEPSSTHDDWVVHLNGSNREDAATTSEYADASLWSNFGMIADSQELVRNPFNAPELNGDKWKGVDNSDSNESQNFLTYHPVLDTEKERLINAYLKK